MKNKLTDLNNHLFEQLERLNDEELQGEKLQSEINRSNAVTGIAKQIINNASLALQAEKMRTGMLIDQAPEMIDAPKDEPRPAQLRGPRGI